MKRFIAILLCVLMIVPQAVVGSLASVDRSTDYNAVVDIEVVGTQPLYENIHGDWRSHYDEASDTYVEWFDYECALASADVVFYYADGSTRTVNVHDISGFSFGSSQSYENQWTVGNTYEAHLFFNGENYEQVDSPASCTYYIEIVENPVESIEVTGDFSCMEGTNGWWRSTYIEEESAFVQYFYYDPINFLDEIRFNYKDGHSETIEAWELDDYTDGRHTFSFAEQSVYLSAEKLISGMLFIIKQKPLNTSLRVPFIKLGYFISHKRQLLAGLSHIISHENSHLVKLFIIASIQLSYKR